jgi:hypothetical protein
VEVLKPLPKNLMRLSKGRKIKPAQERASLRARLMELKRKIPNLTEEDLLEADSLETRIEEIDRSPWARKSNTHTNGAAAFDQPKAARYAE